MITLQTELSCYTDGGMLACVLGDLAAAVGGQGQFGVLVGGVFLLSVWLAGDGDIATPAVMTVLAGGLLIPILPPSYASIARTIAFVGLVGALLAAGEKYVLEGQQ